MQLIMRDIQRGAYLRLSSLTESQRNGKDQIIFKKLVQGAREFRNLQKKNYGRNGPLVRVRGGLRMCHGPETATGGKEGGGEETKKREKKEGGKKEG